MDGERLFTFKGVLATNYKYRFPVCFPVWVAGPFFLGIVAATSS